MDSLNASALEFLDRCDQHPTMYLLVKDFSQTVEAFGFHYFIMTSLPGPGEKLDSLMIAHNWPAFWLDHYLEQNYAQHDAVLALAPTLNRPFTFKEAREAPNRSSVDLILAAEAEHFGVRDGFAMTMGDTVRLHAAVSLTSQDPVSLSPMHRKLLHMVCLNAQMRAVELRNAQRTKAQQLSDREREIFKWLASGKSFWETSEILGISPATVKTHVLNARTKMDASNATHAIVRAIREKQIII